MHCPDCYKLCWLVFKYSFTDYFCAGYYTKFLLYDVIITSLSSSSVDYIVWNSTRITFKETLCTCTKKKRKQRTKFCLANVYAILFTVQSPCNTTCSYRGCMKKKTILTMHDLAHRAAPNSTRSGLLSWDSCMISLELQWNISKHHTLTLFSDVREWYSCVM